MLILLGLFVFLATVSLVPLAARILIAKGLLDTPRVQSSHEVPTPRGGGLAVMPVILFTWAGLLWNGFYSWPTEQAFTAFLVCGVFLCSFTWFDDTKPGGLRVRTRLFAQLIAVAIPLFCWPAEMGRLLPEFVPLGVERVLMALAWIWFLNLYNFMDGINGISAIEAICIAGGLLLYTLYGHAAMPPGYAPLLVTLIAAALGFLVWNGRRVAKIFLGDVGSVGFGYCLAWVLFVFAAQGYFVPAVLVALVYCMDASITLLKRAWQKKKIWQAHREHFYHRATVKGGLSHAQCVTMIAIVNAVLIYIGWLLLHSVMRPWQGLVLGIALVLLLLFCFYSLGQKHGHRSSPRPKAFRIERLGRLFLKKRKKSK